MRACETGLYLVRQRVPRCLDGRQIGSFPIAWIVPLFAIRTTWSGLMLDQRWPADWPPPWLLWPTLFAAGLTALTFVWRIRFGQLRDTRRSTTP
ncbi:hypothetical protein KPP03845_200146 (plasmid) [Streptomyces xanthophaeus]|nr:hypothetical protein KPP03845_200146 [Streptomyces xanthophaeus]